MEYLLSANIEKMRYHANAAEKAQMRIEAMERQAEEAGRAMQRGRLRRRNKTVISDGYMADVLLRTNHQYRSLVGTRNGHQAQVAMYSALIQAGVHGTGYGRHSTDGQHFELRELAPTV